MATQLFSCSLHKTLSLFSRSFLTATGAPISVSSHSSSSLLRRLRPLAAILTADFRCHSSAPSVRNFSTRSTSSSIKDLNPNWSIAHPRRPYCLMAVILNTGSLSWRSLMINSRGMRLSTPISKRLPWLSEVRKKLYSVSTRCYFAFGCLVSEELSYKIKELPKVRWVLPDSYLDVKKKDYGGEPFINGQAVPYDPKYHEEWIRNNAKANNKRTDVNGRRNFDRSRNSHLLRKINNI